MPQTPDAPLTPEPADTVTTTGRGPLTWVVAGLAVVVIVVVAALALLGGEDAEVPLADGTSADGSDGADGESGPTVTRLEVGAEPGRCMRPTAEAIARQPLALEATVVGIDDGLAVLEPVRFFAGRATDRVEVAAPTQGQQALLGSVALEEGGRYLVAAADGRVLGCGLSGPAEPELAELYAEAFNR